MCVRCAVSVMHGAAVSHQEALMLSQPDGGFVIPPPCARMDGRLFAEAAF